MVHVMLEYTSRSAYDERVDGVIIIVPSNIFQTGINIAVNTIDLVTILIIID